MGEKVNFHRFVAVFAVVITFFAIGCAEKNGGSSVSYWRISESCAINNENKDLATEPCLTLPESAENYFVLSDKGVSDVSGAQICAKQSGRVKCDDLEAKLVFISANKMKFEFADAEVPFLIMAVRVSSEQFTLVKAKYLEGIKKATESVAQLHGKTLDLEKEIEERIIKGRSENFTRFASDISESTTYDQQNGDGTIAKLTEHYPKRLQFFSDGNVLVNGRLNTVYEPTFTENHPDIKLALTEVDGALDLEDLASQGEIKVHGTQVQFISTSSFFAVDGDTVSEGVRIVTKIYNIVE